LTTISSVAGSDGVIGDLQPAEGENATFESEVNVTGEMSFLESGSITFGKGSHRIFFSTIGQGHLAPSADPKLKHGSVTWKIDRGIGQFEGATGLITSNFTIGDKGDVIDNHFGLIFAK
jgi:hypothetical protein